MLFRTGRDERDGHAAHGQHARGAPDGDHRARRRPQLQAERGVIQAGLTPGRRLGRQRTGMTGQRLDVEVEEGSTGVIAEPSLAQRPGMRCQLTDAVRPALLLRLAPRGGRLAAE